MRSIHRPTALAGAVLVALLGAAPASAAGITGGSASAVTVTAGGQDYGTGTYSVQYDGHKTASGSNQPAMSTLGGQSLINAGTLAQDADADARGSRACAGLAGQGATAVRVGDGDCLRGGHVLTLDAGHVDLGDLTLDDGTYSSQLPPELSTGAAQITTAVGDAFQQALQKLGNPGLTVDLGVVEGTCAAHDGGAQGDTRLTGARVVLTPPPGSGQGPITLLTLPASPAPNSSYSADLGQLAELVRADVEAQLKQSFQGSLKGLVPAADQAGVLSSALSQVSQQLQPVTGQVISVIANAQSRSASAIDLTALDLRLLPGQVQGADAFRLRVGHVQCGPTSTPRPQAAGHVPDQRAKLPTSVSAGLEGTPGHDPVRVALIAIAVLAAGSVGLAGWRGARR